ncbi:TPA: hypothetical protein HA251_02020 [Candidatus Woesearchaeota archaeon]|nr:hypothetical protein [Candidatus Woesearchaeota archaeon]
MTETLDITLDRLSENYARALEALIGHPDYPSVSTGFATQGTLPLIDEYDAACKALEAIDVPVRRAIIDKDWSIDPLAPLREIAPHIHHPSTVYVIGGAALVQYGIKQRTKDLDIVCIEDSRSDDAVHYALERCLYTRIGSSYGGSDVGQPDTYTKGATKVEVFGREIIEQYFSYDMERRSRFHAIIDKLIIQLADPLDIMILKDLTRPSDREDVIRIAKCCGVDEKRIKEELREAELPAHPSLRHSYTLMRPFRKRSAERMQQLLEFLPEIEAEIGTPLREIHNAYLVNQQRPLLSRLKDNNSRQSSTKVVKFKADGISTNDIGPR